jgi:hypothetical protein
MWDVVGIVAAVVVIVLLLQMLDLAEVLKGKIRGDAPQSDLEKRLRTWSDGSPRWKNADPDPARRVQISGGPTGPPAR